MSNLTFITYQMETETYQFKMAATLVPETKTEAAAAITGSWVFAKRTTLPPTT